MPARVIAKAPSNIALIKYMGKQDASRNLPTNPSLSLTLDRFCTFAELTDLEYGGSTGGPRWLPEPPLFAEPYPDLPWALPETSARGAARIDAYFGRLACELPPVLARFGLGTRTLSSFTLRTANTFPSSAGLASSASAFAAITVAIAAALCDDPAHFQACWKEDALRIALAGVSRLGSGSSCRSFLGPWVTWREDSIARVNSTLAPCSDLVMLVRTGPKKVSSSEAHARVATSPAWKERPARATQRTEALIRALAVGDGDTIARLGWQDCLDMHHLFHTSDPAFTYWEPLTFEILRWLMEFSDGKTGELPPPIATLDAGPNVHLIVPRETAPAWRARLSVRFPDIALLEDTQGEGATLLC